MSNSKKNGNSNKPQTPSKVIKENSLAGISAMKPAKPVQSDNKTPGGQGNSDKGK